MAAEVFKCPSYLRLLRLAANLLGQSIHCPTCDAIFAASKVLPAETNVYPVAPTVAERLRPAEVESDEYDADNRPRRRDLAPASWRADPGAGHLEPGAVLLDRFRSMAPGRELNSCLIAASILEFL